MQQSVRLAFRWEQAVDRQDSFDGYCRELSLMYAREMVRFWTRWGFIANFEYLRRWLKGIGEERRLEEWRAAAEADRR